MTRTIGFVGCMNHIGTTTQAIQAVLSLIEQKNLNVCYLESNRTNYVDNVKNLYRMVEDKDAYIKFSGIDMYRRNYANLIYSSNRNYDFIVKDFGNANSETFEEGAFSEQQIKVVICGSKPNEIFETQHILMNEMFKDAYFVFSFVPEDERASILALMRSKANKTFFSDIILDPYRLNPSSVNIYQNILKVKQED